MAPPTVHSASETLAAPGFYMQDFQEQSVILFQEVVMLKEANMIPAIAGVTLTSAEELATERSSILAADEVRYKHVVRLNLDQKSYEKHNRRAEIVAAMFLKRKLYALGLHQNIFRSLPAELLFLVLLIVTAKKSEELKFDRSHSREILFVMPMSGTLVSERVAIDQRRPSSSVVLNPREILMPVEPMQVLRATTLPPIYKLNLHDNATSTFDQYSVTKWVTRSLTHKRVRMPSTGDPCNISHICRASPAISLGTSASTRSPRSARRPTASWLGSTTTTGLSARRASSRSGRS